MTLGPTPTSTKDEVKERATLPGGGGVTFGELSFTLDFHPSVAIPDLEETKEVKERDQSVASLLRCYRLGNQYGNAGHPRFTTG